MQSFGDIPNISDPTSGYCEPLNPNKENKLQCHPHFKCASSREEKEANNC